ncbi:MAG: oxidoreductase [Bdellovibrionota bacterium]
MKILNIGLIGYGFSGSTFHAPIIDCISGLKLTHIVSKNIDKVREKYKHVAILNNVEEIYSVKEIDLVIITTPNTEHYSMAKQALLANKHVVVEKPFVVHSYQGKELIALAKERNLILSVYHNRRWDNGFLTLKKVLENKILGEIYSYEAYYDRFRPLPATEKWREQNSIGSGVLYDLGSHLIDQALHLFGKPTAIFMDTEIQRKNAQATDYFEIIFSYNKMRVILGSSSVRLSPRPVLSVHGSEGSFVKYGLDPQEQQLKLGENPSSKNWGVEPATNSAVLTVQKNGLVEPQHLASLPGSYEKYYEGIYDCIVHKKENPVDAGDALSVIEVICGELISKYQ